MNMNACGRGWGVHLSFVVLLAAALCANMAAQQANAQSGAPAETPSKFRENTNEDYNRRLQQLPGNLADPAQNIPAAENLFLARGRPAL